MKKKFIEKFRVEELKVLDFKYWQLSLRPEQSTLGALIISLKRGCTSISKLTSKESSELQRVFQETELLLEKVFDFDKINYLCLMMIDDQVHFHVIPRYKNNKIFEDVVFEDIGWPALPLLNKKEINDEVLFSIKDIIINSVLEKNNIVVGYTTGVYDLFHVGHLNVLREAKKLCDKLIVGITTDELCLSRKGKSAIIPFNERCEIIKSLSIVDEVVAQSNMDKFEAWSHYKFNRMFVGDDWKGSPVWSELDLKFQEVGVEIIYFPYTKSTSSTILRERILSVK